ncbi:MAG: RNA-binding domain-containing protein [Thermoproteus sp.]
MKVEVIVEIRPTEDPEKVKKALLNVFEPEGLETRSEGDAIFLIARASSYKSLLKLKDAIWRQGIQDAARSVLSRSLAGENRIVFHLNKQAAYVGVVSFATEPGESPLGPIIFNIETSDIRRFLDWIAPRTYKGKVFYEGPPPD